MSSHSWATCNYGTSARGANCDINVSVNTYQEVLAIPTGIATRSLNVTHATIPASNMTTGWFTYRISSEEDDPDVRFARYGSALYNSKHREFIVEPTHEETDEFTGDNAVRQFFELIETNGVYAFPKWLQ